MDNNLYIEELPEEKQPGTHVRRVNGKELNDDEMIEYYCNLVKEYGGKLKAKWVYGMVIYDGKEKKEMTDYIKTHGNEILKDKRVPKRDKFGIISLKFGFGFYKFIWRLYLKITKRF